MLTISRLLAVVMGVTLVSSVSLAETQLILKKDIAFNAENSRSSQSIYVLRKNDHCYMSLVGNNLRNSQYVNAQGLIVLPAGLKFKVINVVDNEKGLDLETKKIYVNSTVYSTNQEINTSLVLVAPESTVYSNASKNLKKL